jgi:hypothetical protein
MIRISGEAPAQGVDLNRDGIRRRKTLPGKAAASHEDEKTSRRASSLDRFGCLSETFRRVRGAGLTKSAVSRRFVVLSAARMKEWLASDLSGLDCW